MNESDVAKEILKSLNNNKMVELNINTFVSLWFNNKKFNEYDITKKFLRFKTIYNLDYVLLLNPRGGVLGIRFWKKKKENEQKSIEQGTTMEETFSDTNSTIEDSDKKD